MSNQDNFNYDAENGVLSSLFQYGQEAFIEVSDIISEKSFIDPTNISIYNILKNHFSENENIDLAIFLSKATSCGYREYFDKPENKARLKLILQNKVNKESSRQLAAQLKKLEITRLYRGELQNIDKSLSRVTGEESLSNIVDLVESPIFNISISLDKDSEGPKLIFKDIEEYVEYLENNPVDQIGLSTGYRIYDLAIGGGLRKKTVNVIGARPKALVYGSKVYTKKGPINIEKIRVGDEIIHPFNKTSIVTGVFDHYDVDIYRIFFKDGDFVDCSGDHLWEVYKRYPYSKLELKNPIIKTTNDLINDVKIGKKSENKWDVRLTDTVEYSSKKVPVDPYVLGVLLGNGSVGNNTCCYHTMDNEIHEYMYSYFTNHGYEVKFESKNSKCSTYRVNGFQDKLRELNIFGCNCYNKFIPKDYIYNSEDIRKNILAGLLDTDGTCTINKSNGKSRIKFSSVSLQLCLDLKEIVQSLGGLCSINKGKSKCNGKIFSYYCCEIRFKNKINPFKLSRKANRVNDRFYGEIKRTIIKIEKIEKGNARCISINNPDGLFLTDNFVITHNCGKSALADNIALFNIKNGVNVLMLDTELSEQDHIHRILAMMSNVSINEIETGAFRSSFDKKKRVKNSSSLLKDLPYNYINIAGKPFEETISKMRRWCVKNVSEHNPGLIILDYIKMMDSSGISKNISEFQALGFLMTSLHNFTIKYDIPCLAFIQLNRDGINREDTDVASGSDRIIWLCSNFSIFKSQSEEEIQLQPDNNRFNRKLVPIVQRHGGGLDDGDFINMRFTRNICKIEEGPTRNEMVDTASQQGELTNDDESEIF